MPHEHYAQYEAMANDDDYDPRKPEYIIPATEEQMTRTNIEVLGKQIAQLEDVLKSRQAESNPKTYQHYEQVTAELHYEAGQLAGSGRSSHLQMQSDPAKQPDEAVNNGPKTVTDASIRSAPDPASSFNIVPPDDEPLRANRVNGSGRLHSLGEQHAASISPYATLLGSSARPAAFLLPKLGPNPSKGPHRAVARGPSPPALTCPAERPRPSPRVSTKIAPVLTKRGTNPLLPSECTLPDSGAHIAGGLGGSPKLHPVHSSCVRSLPIYSPCVRGALLYSC